LPQPRRGEGNGEVAEELGPLPGGFHGLSRQQIADSQRERLMAAMAEAVADRGYRATTITELTKSASVSSRDFYGLFESKEDCFLATFDAVVGHLEVLVRAAAANEDGWAQQVIAALRAALGFFAAEPDLARLCLLDSASATPTIAARFREAVLSCAPGLARGREELEDPDSLPPETEGTIAGGAVSLATRSLLTGRAEDLPALLPDLTEFVLGSYLGSDRASALAANL
jgi:AcrR family transcriptional regulator